MQQPRAVLSFSDHLYRRFLRAYPAEYRQGFSEEMAQVVRHFLCPQAAGVGAPLKGIIDRLEVPRRDRRSRCDRIRRSRRSSWRRCRCELAGPLEEEDYQ